MKIRNGFVSNSSSSSFIIKTEYLTRTQRNKILTNTQEDQGDCCGPHWNIEEIEGYIRGDVEMDNYDMQEFFDQIGVPDKIVTWDGDLGELGPENYNDNGPATPPVAIECPECGHEFYIQIKAEECHEDQKWFCK